MNDQPSPDPDAADDAEVVEPAELAAAAAVAALADEPVLTAAEASQMDAAVMASAAGEAVYREALRMSAPTPLKRRSPRSRGKRPAPYFAVAAGIAVVLSIAIGLFASQLLGGGGAPGPTGDVAALPSVERGADAAASDANRTPSAAPDATPESPGNGPGAPPAAGAGAGAPAAAGGAAKAAVGPATLPQLFVSDIDAADRAAVAAQIAQASPVAASQADAIAALVRAGSGIGLGDDLVRCLPAVLGTAVPVRVVTATLRGEPAFVVVTAPAAGAAPAGAIVLTRIACGVRSVASS